MELETQEQVDFIKMVANYLAEKLIWCLFPPTKEKNYSEHIGVLAEILEWSEEFYGEYYDKMLNWETFRYSRENVHNAETHNELIMAFGLERLKKFYAQNRNHTTYFRDKYAMIMNEDYDTV